MSDHAPPLPDDAVLRRRVQGVLDIALHRFLGIRLLDEDNPGLGIALPVEAAALDNAEVLHGGIVTGLLDIACYLALLPQLTVDENAMTHDLSASHAVGPPWCAPAAAGSRPPARS